MFFVVVVGIRSSVLMSIVLMILRYVIVIRVIRMMKM